MLKMTIEDVAKLCHEVNRTYCLAIGDASQQPWDAAPKWQRDSAVNGVKIRLENPDDHPRMSHEGWLRQKLGDGWKFGPVKDAEKKEHPCCVPYEELPPEQRVKDFLFVSVVMSLRETGMIEGVDAQEGL